MPMRSDYPRYPRDVRAKQIVSRPARERRLEDLHLTAFPSVVNADSMTVPPPTAEKSQTTKTPKVEMQERAVAVMTTNQLVARMAEMAREESLKNATSTEKKSLSAPDGRVLMPGVEFDRSSTYRLDYCNKDLPGFHARVRNIPDYTKDWTDIDKSNIEQAMKVPYLTLPGSLLKQRPTVYRHDYIPAASREEYRTVSCETNLQDLGTSFAYSAYTVNDPARVIKYDKVVASCHNPRCLLWKTYSPRDSFAEKMKVPESTAEELQRLRELRRTQVSQMTTTTESSGKGSEGEGKTSRKIVLPGMRGMGYRQAPREGEDYIYLPRDHFCHQVVYDY
ncbi:uncharacterized protein TM35_000022400 [Trypanosoma theileri]|uniref:Uncharacterized protein n=1 Tax=Trypanosoma theileri TaxID=67003 RepID=A0A1X0P7K9_9TRYP|nr:uncharacterized protein TM35_000022400 [Trypanosoma theileri]ORC92914.1 hypothetical protein TM35_000022400 [Trypanosoma theileri]